MPQLKVRVKWGKQKFDDVEVDIEEPPSVFKMQLFSLSGVPPDRQKVMVGGVTLSDEDWGRAASKLKPNVMLLMMGSVEQLPQAPVQKTKFLEDMSEAEAAAALALPSGLPNYGNTCYMNATLQCLKVVPELKEVLWSYEVTQDELAMASTPGSPQALTTGLRMLYKSMEPHQMQMLQVPLVLFMESLHSAVPIFSEKDEKTGGFRQQDAHECWSALFTSLAQTLTSYQGDQRLKFMDQYFGVQLQNTYKCLESSEEMETTESEKSFQVACFISQDIKYMHTGLKKGLEGTVEKASPSLGRDAQYSKISRITRLPGYLTVQFIRFFVGRAGDSAELVSKKILKDVKFPAKLDMYDFCTPELQEKLLPQRSKYKEVEDRKAAIKAKMIAEGRLFGPKQNLKVPQQEVMNFEPFDTPDDPGCSNSGFYELSAVLTHQGRSSSSGHYLSWVKHKPGEWLKLDDDNVTVVLEEDVLKLSGGGDWHIAYILLYAPRRLEIVIDPTEKGGEGEKTETATSTTDRDN